MNIGDEQKTFSKILKRKNCELDIMMDIGKTLTSSRDLDEVLKVLMDKVALLLKPMAWSLLLVDEQSNELYFEIAVSHVGEHLKKIRLKMGEGVAGWVARHGEPVLIDDRSEEHTS